MVNRVGRFLVMVLLALLAPRTGSAAPIEEGYFVPINGMEQWITIRGRDLRNVDPVKLLMDALRPLWKEMFTFEAASLGFVWEIPMFCFQAELDITTPTVLAKEYFDAIKAPTKEFAVIQGAGHATVFFADELLPLPNLHVRPRVMETKWVR